MKPEWKIRELTAADRDWVETFMVEHWFAPTVIVHGESYRPAEHPGFACFKGGQLLGLVTYRLAKDEIEVLTLDSLSERQGIGSALLTAVIETAEELNLKKVWLITTNDNLNALKFYQKFGLRITSVSPGAVDRSRSIKPNIPAIGEYGIPLHDEIELSILIGE